MQRIDRRAVIRLVAVAAASLALATLAISLLETAGLQNASAVYLAAVVATAFVAGTWGAIVAAVAAFVLYDFLSRAYESRMARLASLVDPTAVRAI